MNIARVALLIESSRTYGRGVLRGIAQYAHVRGPWSFYAQERELHSGIPAWLQNWKGHGIIARIEDRRTAKALLRLGMPVVDVLGNARFEGIHGFDTDAEAVARVVVEFLLRAGFRNFAYCGYRAFRSNSKDARLLYERDQLWKRLGEKPTKRLRELEKHPELVRQRDDLSVELCALQNQTGQHAKALALVRSRNFQPWEGGEGGPLGQHVRSLLALGRQALANENAVKARGYFEAALTAPRNLGEAKHLLTNQSDIHYWLGCALAELDEEAKAREHWLAAANFRGDFQEMSVRAFSEMTFYSALSLKRLGQRMQAKRLLRDLRAYARKLQQSEAKIDYFATSLPTMLLFDDNLQFRQDTTALFLQAQAHLGLGHKARAKALLGTVLKRDPNHALAADFAAEHF